MRNLFFVFGGLIYLISPLDLLPEAVFGIVGFIDDAAVVLIVLATCAEKVRDVLVQGNNNQARAAR